MIKKKMLYMMVERFFITKNYKARNRREETITTGLTVTSVGTVELKKTFNISYCIESTMYEAERERQHDKNLTGSI